ncbi:hypothetical protein [Nocardioides immobilis]|uniref:hypothetical protein n=1 Tax=Nocardioides immobilis TaxID=2049295 RepID=UPI0011C4052C|nr:hypothetical protein [Nocardioides immobilis]
MNVTELARSLLEPVPAHRTPGTRDVRTDHDPAESPIATPSTMNNVVGSLHSGGLIALMMQLARQRSSERATPSPTSESSLGVRRSNSADWRRKDAMPTAGAPG